MVRSKKLEDNQDRPGYLPWEARHDEVLTRAMIRTLLTARPSLSHIPGIEGEVNGHGGNRVSQKVLDACKRLAKVQGFAEGVVKEEVEAMKGDPGKKRKAEDDGAKPKKGRQGAIGVKAETA